MRILRVRFDTLSFVGAAFMIAGLAYGSACYRGDGTPLASRVIVFGIFAFVGCMLLLISLSIGERQRRCARDGDNGSRSDTLHVEPPLMRVVRYLVWSGAVFLLLDFYVGYPWLVLSQQFPAIGGKIMAASLIVAICLYFALSLLGSVLYAAYLLLRLRRFYSRRLRGSAEETPRLDAGRIKGIKGDRRIY